MTNVKALEGDNLAIALSMAWRARRATEMIDELVTRSGACDVAVIYKVWPDTDAPNAWTLVITTPRMVHTFYGATLAEAVTAALAVTP